MLFLRMVQNVMGAAHVVAWGFGYYDDGMEIIGGIWL